MTFGSSRTSHLLIGIFSIRNTLLDIKLPKGRRISFIGNSQSKISTSSMGIKFSLQEKFELKTSSFPEKIKLAQWKYPLRYFNSPWKQNFLHRKFSVRDFYLPYESKDFFTRNSMEDLNLPQGRQNLLHKEHLQGYLKLSQRREISYIQNPQSSTSPRKRNFPPKECILKNH